MRVLDLCSGIGGFSIGLERAGFETVAFCEIEDAPRKVLLRHWPNIPCHNDIRTLKGSDIEAVDIICGGYPCQPFSKAGKRRGSEDSRHLWPDFIRLISELRPAWFIGENVTGHVSLGIDEVLSGLEAENYTARPFLIPACGVDAPHKRERCWVIASNNDTNAHSKRPHREGVNKFGNNEPHDGEISQLGSVCEVLAEQCGATIGHTKFGLEFERWKPEPRVGRMANGIPNRVDRIKMLGNSVAPRIPEIIGRAIMASALT